MVNTRTLQCSKKRYKKRVTLFNARTPDTLLGIRDDLIQGAPPIELNSTSQLQKNEIRFTEIILFQR